MPTPPPNARPSRDDLASWFEGAQSKAPHRVGTEQEKFGFYVAESGLLEPIRYEPHVRRVLDELVSRFGWGDGDDHGTSGEQVMLSRDGASITLEPGGQFELSGAPKFTIHETCAEFSQHYAEIDEIGRDLGITWVAAGFHPFSLREEIDWMPKGRYVIMRDYLPTRGSRALDMMKRTCTVQANLDYASEAECGRRFQLALRISPLMTALFANSPFYEGRANGLRSNRSDVWEDVDPDRCGYPKALVDEPFSYERYVDYAMGVPMFFIKRGGRYIPHHAKFTDFLEHGLTDERGEHHDAQWKDWVLHTSTLFPEVRIKPFIEFRGCDSIGSRFICSLPAVARGVLYDDDACQEASEWVSDLDQAAVLDLWRRGRRDGLSDPDVLARSRRLVQIARGGLERLDERDAQGRTEARFLDPLDEDLAEGRGPGQVAVTNAGLSADLDGRGAEGRLALARAFHFAGADL